MDGVVGPHSLFLAPIRIMMAMDTQIGEVLIYWSRFLFMRVIGEPTGQ